MTNNKQHTAVEWFAIALYENGFLTGNGDEIQELLEKAKEMEKEQIINAFSNGDNTDCTSEQNIEEFADQYYEQTYGGNK
jgi:hypothetical protein